MGQYYIPTNLDIKEYIYPFDYENGSKLMEHSWIGNEMINIVETLLSEGQAWHKASLLWAGDYADEEKGGRNIFNTMFDEGTRIKEKRTKKGLRFIINHSKKEYIDKEAIEGVEGWRVHPLPLLTAEGNGRGGGDYRKEDNRIGSWARDNVSVSKKKPEGYSQINGTFFE